jgi:hypothetical protein
VFSFIKLVVGGLIALSFALGIGFVYGVKHQKAAFAAQVAEGKIQVLKEGKAVDEKVYNADDSTLCDLLGGC